MSCAEQLTAVSNVATPNKCIIDCSDNGACYQATLNCFNNQNYDCVINGTAQDSLYSAYVNARNSNRTDVLAHGVQAFMYGSFYTPLFGSANLECQGQRACYDLLCVHICFVCVCVCVCHVSVDTHKKRNKKETKNATKKKTTQTTKNAQGCSFKKWLEC